MCVKDWAEYLWLWRVHTECDSFWTTGLKTVWNYLGSACISCIFHKFCIPSVQISAYSSFSPSAPLLQLELQWHISACDAGTERRNGHCCTSDEILFPCFAGGLMNPWRRRWCVLKNEAFMWFRTKQEALKSGWLYKKGGGMSTLSRRNWKRRWFVLRESKLMYFENDSEEKLKGTIDIRRAKWVRNWSFWFLVFAV